MESQVKTKRIAEIALLTVVAFMFSYIESLFPIPLPVPGIKIGIANIAVLIALYRFDFKTAFGLNMIRIVISGLLFSGVFGMIYSFSGGLLSIFTMYLLKKTGLFSMTGISMAGGVMHNLGQLITASLIMETPGLMVYFPVLLFSGIVSGIIIGIISYSVERKLPHA